MIPRKVKAGAPIWLIAILVIVFIYVIWTPGGAVRRELILKHPKEAIFSSIKNTGGGRYLVKPSPKCTNNTCAYYLCTREAYLKFVKCSVYPNAEDLTNE